MSPDRIGSRPRSPEEQPQKPRIVVHDSSVDFGDVRFNVNVFSDYTVSSISVMSAEGRHLTEEQQGEMVARAMPWIDRVLDYDPIGPWGEARFRADGMELIDEVQETYYWTFPLGGEFRPGIPLPERWAAERRIPREYRAQVFEGNLDDVNPFDPA